MQLLQDIFIIEQLQVLSEGKADGPMKIRGVFGRCNEKNNNGRIYPTAVLESQLAKVKPLISERRLCGELDHPANDTVKLSNASHLITKLDMKGDELIGEAEILRTPAGLTAKALVEGGVKIGISSRGMGTLSEDHNGDKIVNEDFRLVTFDLVADPSTRGAYPGLSESVESKFVKDSQSKLTKESNFVTMLNSKMRDAYKPFLEENAKKGYPGVKGGTAAAEEMEEEKGKKKLTKKQRKLDVEPEGGDGDIDSKDLAKLRGEAFELVKADGHWHRIADAIAEGFGKKVVTEAFDDEVDKESATKLAQREPAKDSGSMLGNFRAKRHAKGMEIAKAKGARKGAKILAKGDVEADRIRARGKAGGSVSMNPFGAGSAAFAKNTGNLEKTKARQDRISARLGNTLKDQVGKAKGNDPVAKNDPVNKTKVNEPKGDVTGGAAGRKFRASKNKPKVNEPKEPKKSGEVNSNPAPPTATNTGRMDQKAIDADKAKRSAQSSNAQVALQQRLAALKGDQASSKQSFQTTLGRKRTRGQKETPSPMTKALKKQNLNTSRSYKQIGLVLAEALKGTDSKSKSGYLKKKQNPHGNAEGEPGALARTPRLPNGDIDKKTIRHNMKANMNSQNAG